VNILAANMIDDMEHGTGSILTQGGRIGAWFTFNDGTAAGTQTPLAGSAFLPTVIPGGRGTSAHAAETHGSGFTVWGSGMGFDLNNSGTAKHAYSVAGFTGLAFWAHGTPASIRVNVLTTETTPTASGGTCTLTCSDNYGATLDLGSGWVQYVVPFTSLMQQGWGTPVAFDPTAVLSVQFQVTQNNTFDVWIDDIGLY
jgi:Carbohydrate binding domain (family 11)